MSNQRGPRAARASGVAPGGSSGSLDVPVRDPVRDIRDLQDLPEGIGARLEAVLAKSARVLSVVVGRNVNRTLRIPNLGRIQFFVDRPVCRNAGRVVGAATRTYRRLVPPVLRTVQRRRRRRQKSLAKGSPRREGTVVPVGIRGLWIPRLEWARGGRIPLPSLSQGGGKTVTPLP